MSRTEKHSPSAQARGAVDLGPPDGAATACGGAASPRSISRARHYHVAGPALGLLFGLVSAINAHFELAAVMILIAFVCDGLDGRVARLSRTSSHFGVEYDSLSDVVAFGVAPAGLVYTWSLRIARRLGVVIAGMFVICAALRLARFNVQTAQHRQAPFRRSAGARRGRDDRGLRARLQLFRIRVAARAGHRDRAADGGARRV